LALTLQNGLGNRETLEQTLGAQRVALGVTTVGAYLVEPGLVQAAGAGMVSLGEHPRLSFIKELLEKAGFNVRVVQDANALLWNKLIVNAAINPLTAILGVSNGALLENEDARALMGEVAREAAAVALAQGIQLTDPDPAALAEAVARRTAANRSSMLQDILRHAPTEIDAICGAIVRAGQQTGVPTPITRTLWRLVKALESKG
jgi:2-dehydropantoate 2-reductase